MPILVGLIIDSGDEHFLPVSQPIHIAALGGNTQPTNIRKAKVNIYLLGQNAPYLSYVQEYDPAVSDVANNNFVINFDIHEVLRDLVTLPLPALYDTKYDGTVNLVNFKIGVIGYYPDNSNVWHAYPEEVRPASAPWYYGINSYVPQGNQFKYLERFIIGNSASLIRANFLTNAPDRKAISLNDSEFLAGYNDNNFTNIALIARKGVLGLDPLNFEANFGMQIVPLGLQLMAHYFVGVGPGNLPDEFIDNHCRGYSVWLAELGTNGFTDATNGTMEANVNGLVSTTGAPLTHSNTQSYLGAYSAMIDGATVASGISGTYHVLHNTSSLILAPDTDYYLSSYIFIEKDHSFVEPDNLTFQWNTYSTGFAGAYTEATQKVSMAHGNIYCQWLPLITLINTVSTSMSGTFELFAKVDGSGTLSGLKIYIDHITLVAAPRITQKRTYILNSPNQAAATRVHFINRLGGMDSYTFTAAEVKHVTVAQTQYEKYLGLHPTYADRGRTVQAVTAQEKWVCTSDLLTAAEAKWLEELLTSPSVYIQQNGQYVPVTANDAEFETVNDDTNGIVLSIEFVNANNIVTQRG